jgi:hypothetical protein
MRSNPAEFASGCRSRSHIDPDLDIGKIIKEIEQEAQRNKLVNDEDSTESLGWCQARGNEINHSHMEGLLHNYRIFTTEVVAVV